MKKIIAYILSIIFVFELFSTSAMANEIIKNISETNQSTTYELGDIITNDKKGIEDLGLYNLLANDEGKVVKEDVIKIKELVIDKDSKVSSLKGIEYCTELEKIIISSPYLTSLEGVSNLAKLEEIVIYKDEATNLISKDEVDNCPNLKNVLIKVKEYEPEDVNRDGYVNQLDLDLVRVAYNCKPGDSEWNVDYDINKDGIIDLFDLVMVCKKLEDPMDVAKITSFQTDKTSGQEVGSKIKISATSNAGAEHSLYEFAVKDTSGNWSVIKTYNTSNNVYWTPNISGTYMLRVRVRHSYPDVEFQDERIVPFDITGRIKSSELYLQSEGVLSLNKVYQPLIKVIYDDGKFSFQSPEKLEKVGDVINIVENTKISSIKAGTGQLKAHYKGNVLNKEIKVFDEANLINRVDQIKNDTTKNESFNIRIEGKWITEGIKLVWNEDAPIITNYKIKRKSGNGEFKDLDVSKITKDINGIVSFIDNNTDNNKEYTYTITAVKIDNTSQELKPITIIPTSAGNGDSNINNEPVVNSNGEVVVDVEKPFYIKKELIDKFKNKFKIKYNKNYKDFDYNKLELYKYEETTALTKEPIEDRKFRDIQYAVQYDKTSELNWKVNGDVATSAGVGVKTLSIKFSDDILNQSVQYRTHTKVNGWKTWSQNGEVNGDYNKAEIIDGVQIKLTNKPSNQFIEYRVYLSNSGWQKWKKDGEISGVEDGSEKVLAVQVRTIDSTKLSKLEVDKNLISTFIEAEGVYILRNRDQVEKEVSTALEKEIVGESDDKVDDNPKDDDIIIGSEPKVDFNNESNKISIYSSGPLSGPIKYGETSNMVGILQSRLLSLGFKLEDGKVSKYYGDYTKNAVLAFQKYYFSKSPSLQTGLCDDTTIRQLNMIVSVNETVKAELRRLEAEGMSSMTVSPGQQNNATIVLQEKLIKLGFDLGNNGVATGYYGNYTKASVMAIQLANSLAPTGTYSSNIQVIINRYLAPGGYPAATKSKVMAQYEIAVGYIELNPGQQGELVRKLQNNLIKLGFDLGTGSVATGYYGKYTMASLKAIQLTNGLSINDANGRYGPKTCSWVMGYIKSPATYNKSITMNNYKKALDYIELDLGESGDLVFNLQKKLIKLGFDLGTNGVATGFFGQYTKASLLALQKAAWPNDPGMHVGRYGPSTINLIVGYVNGGYTTSIKNSVMLQYNEVLKKIELDPGDRGEAVTVLQRRLKALGFDLNPYGVDGIFGNYTKGAMYAIQESYGLEVIGRFGPQTQNALDILERDHKAGTNTDLLKKILADYNIYKYGYKAKDTTINKSAMYGKTITYYSQTNSDWNYFNYAPAGNINDAGCAPTSMAMVVSTMNNVTFKPTGAAQFAMNNGQVVSSGTYDSYFKLQAENKGVAYENYSASGLQKVKEKLATGKCLAIAWMKTGQFTNGGHYVVLAGVQTIKGQDYFIVYDPNAPNPNYSKNGFSGIKIVENTKGAAIVKASTSIFAKEAISYHVFTGYGQTAPSGPLNPEKLVEKDPMTKPETVIDDVMKAPPGVVGIDPKLSNYKEKDNLLIFALDGTPFIAEVKKIQDRDAAGKYKLWAMPLDYQYFLECNKRPVKNPVLMSILLDFVPVFGTMKATLELISGKDMVTGEDISTSMLAASILIPGTIDAMALWKSKGIVSGDKLTMGLKELAHEIKYGDEFLELIKMYSKKATQNDESMKLVLGKYDGPGALTSYDVVAKEMGATYFYLDNWDEVGELIGFDNMWSINEKFLETQVKYGKKIILSHDPYKATSSYKKEIDYLLDNGYTSFKVIDGGYWEAIK